MLTAFYRKHFLGCDLAFAALCGGLFLFVSMKVVGAESVQTWLDDSYQPIYTTVASICGSLLGFLIAAISILLTISPRKSFRLLLEMGHGDTLKSTFFSAIFWLAAVVVWSIFSLLFKESDSLHLWITTGALSLVVLVTLRVQKCVRILREMISVVFEELTSHKSGAGT